MKRKVSPSTSLSPNFAKRYPTVNYEPQRNDLPSVNYYTVGWICALQEEYECACRMLDEDFSSPDLVEDGDDNTYAYGRIMDHYVVIGCLPAGRYGTNSASRVARDMVRTFPNLRFALMVGIGGGVPTARHDIRLGDVVVSQPKDEFGGVVQYDLGKRLQNGQFQRTGQLNAPPDKLLGVIPELRRLYNDKRKPDRIAEHIQRMDDMEGYHRPTVDQLYQADYLHSGRSSCQQCDSGFLVNRPERLHHRVIRIHYGTIASGNTVLEDAAIRDIYANNLDQVLCFEMEAAGLMNNLPCLVIRGICDYCDSHKNDDWHNFAALTAAAYARELLCVLRSQRVDNMPPWADQITNQLQQVERNTLDIRDAQRGFQSQFNQTVGWQQLRIVEGAAFDSFDNQHDECLLGTRKELLSEVEEWGKSAQSKCIFWLKGMAGTGKSTIARTVARIFHDKEQLGASFFFKRGEADRADAKYLISTIAKQMVIRYPKLAPAVLEAVEKDPDISTKSLSQQFNQLLLQPLVTLNQAYPPTVVIVIDALDECDREDQMKLIIKLFLRVQELKYVQVGIFLTSRPELPIRLGFKESKSHQDLVLHELPEPVIEHDIRKFLEYKLSKIQDERSLPQGWPGNENRERLVRIAVPLFISASTICRFIGEMKWRPEKRLEAILQDQTASSGTQMDKTYLPVLNQMVKDANEEEIQELKQEFQNIIGVIILLAIPLSVNAVARLINLPIGDISNRLDGFYSVLSVPENMDSPVRILHLSFRDYLLTTESHFRVHEQETHRNIALHCLRVMENQLKHNICNLPSYGTQRTEIDPQIINYYLTADLQYSCQYWVHHLKQSKSLIPESKILSFLQKHFLHWLEALALMGRTSESVGLIDTLKTGKQSTDTELSNFLYDARRFTLQNIYMVGIAPLQLYSSGLVFAPVQSIIKKTFSGEILKQIQTIPVVEDSWSPSLQTLEGHSDRVNSVAFSPDGLTLASGSWDKTIKLWNTTTGTQRQTLEGHSACVISVAFSPDGLTLASGSWDKTIKLWDMTTGTQRQTLKGHSDGVTSVAFSPDGLTLASGSDDRTIKLWDTTTGTQRQTLEGHSDPISLLLNNQNSNYQISLANPWIASAGENILWLPAEYRSFDCRAVKDGTLALGYANGRVFFIGFHIR